MYHRASFDSVVVPSVIVTSQQYKCLQFFPTRHNHGSLRLRSGTSFTCKVWQVELDCIFTESRSESPLDIQPRAREFLERLCRLEKELSSALYSVLLYS